MPSRAIFLDRDGVINANIVRDGRPYGPRNSEEFALLPGVEEAVRRAKAAGFLVIVVTNQPDVALGIIPQATADSFHAEIRRRLPLDDIEICWHTEADNCDCRKPKPGLLLRAAAKHEIDLAASYLVGDRWRDIDAAHAAGCHAILVDHGLVQDRPAHPDHTVGSLAEAVTYILERETPPITFVVPCYNEALNIAGTIREIERASASAGLARSEILVVDDCSLDDTAAVVTALLPAHPNVRLARNPRNLGFGGAYKAGVAQAKGERVILIPGDDCYPNESIAAVLRKANEADIVVPYRTNPEGRTWRRRTTSQAFTTLLNMLFGLRIPYYNGIVLHRTALLRSIDIRTDSFAFQAEALIKLIKRGATYVTVGIPIVESEKKKTSAFRWRNVEGVVRAIFALWRDVRQSI